MVSDTKYDVTLETELTYNRVGEVLEVSGTIIVPGTFTDSKGNTVQIDEDVIKQAAPTFKAVPIIIRHTDEEEDILKAVGFSTKTWVTPQGELKYSGIVYRPDAIQEVESGNKDAHSIEATIVSSLVNGVEVAKTMVGEAIALTTVVRAAVPEAKLDGHRLTDQVRLCKFEQKGIMEMPNEGDNIPLGTPLTVEALQAELAKLMPKPVTWENMTDDQKTKIAAEYLKSKGITLEDKKPEEGIALNDPTAQAMTLAMVQAGITKETAQKAFDNFKEKWPKPVTGVDLATSLSTDFDVTTERDKLKTDLEKIKTDKETDELKTIVAETKKLDSTFDEKVFFEGLDSTEKKIDATKRLKTQLERMAKPTGLTEISDTQKTGVNKISMETFGSTPEGLLEMIIPGATKKEG